MVESTVRTSTSTLSATASGATGWGGASIEAGAGGVEFAVAAGGEGDGAADACRDAQPASARAAASAMGKKRSMGQDTPQPLGRSPLWTSATSCPRDLKCIEATHYLASHSPLVMPVV